MLKIKAIWQVNPLEFAIRWSDEKQQIFALPELLKQCPCVLCKRRRREQEIVPPKNLSATRIKNHGKGALKILFTQGCVNGIYPFALLRQLGRSFQK